MLTLLSSTTSVRIYHSYHRGTNLHSACKNGDLFLIRNHKQKRTPIPLNKKISEPQSSFFQFYGWKVPYKSSKIFIFKNFPNMIKSLWPVPILGLQPFEATCMQFFDLVIHHVPLSSLSLNYIVLQHILALLPFCTI